MSTLDETSDFATPFGDLSPDLRVVVGVEALVMRLRRRLQTDAASWPVDRGFGYAVAKELNDSMDDLSRIGRRLEEEVLKDEQVKSAKTDIVVDEVEESVTINITGTSAVGPFRFTVDPSSLTPALLAEQNEIEIT